MDNERIKVLASLAKDVVTVLVKTVKATKMYLPNNPVYQKFREELGEKLDAFFKEEDTLSFAVKRFELEFMGTQVYYNPEKEDNIALMFFKDGIREFAFHDVIKLKEMDAFIDVLKFDAAENALDDDVVTLLWEKDLKGVTYTVAESATEEEAAEEGALFTFEDDIRAVRLYNEMRPRQIGRRASDRPSAGYAEGAPSSAVESHVQVPDDLALLSHLMDIFCEILITEENAERFEAVCQSLTRALDVFISGGHLAHATMLVMEVQGLAGESRLTERRARLDEILAYAASEGPVTKVGEHIDGTDIEALESGGSYLAQLDTRAVPSVIHILEFLGNRKTRKTICDILAGLCKGDGKLLVPYLKHKQWFVVRNVVMVLGKIADQDTVPAVGLAMKHSDTRVRREALTSLAAIGGQRAESIISDSIADPDKNVRLTAAKTFSEISPDKAYPKLLEVASSGAFRDRDLGEKKELYEYIGMSGGAKALPALSKQLTSWRPSIITDQDLPRVLAAYGLAATGLPEAAALLQEGASSKSLRVRDACQEALRNMRRPA